MCQNLTRREGIHKKHTKAILSLSKTHTPLKSEPHAYRKGTPASPAHALAIRVFPDKRRASCGMMNDVMAQCRKACFEGVAAESVKLLADDGLDIVDTNRIGCYFVQDFEESVRLVH